MRQPLESVGGTWPSWETCKEDLRRPSGKTLVCHCGDLDRCHRDTIIEALELAVAKQEKVANDSSVEDLD